MFYPKFIEKGDKIAIPAPSDGGYDERDKNRFENAKQKMEQMGYNVELSKNIFNSKKARSATAKERAEEINKMFERDDINAIICATGGEFLVEILTYVDFEKILKKPKWVQGFSDPTGLLFPLTTKYDIATIYGHNFSNYGANEYNRNIVESLELLKGNMIEQESYELYEEERIKRVTGLEGSNLTEKVEWKVLNDSPVDISGRIIGGCYDLICEIAGTKYDGVGDFVDRYKNDGIIWYFDNCEISKEELIRSLWKLNELGYFKHVKGIIWGRNGKEISGLEYTMEECLKDSVISKFGIPIVYDADISHKSPCMSIINGAIANIKVEGGKGKISFKLI